MEIQAYQEKVDDWIQTYGVRYFNELTNALLLNEEVGELSRLIARKYGEQSFKEEISEAELKEKIADELADIMFVLSCLANQMNINLTEAMSKNFAKKTNRDKDRHRQNTKLDK